MTNLIKNIGWAIRHPRFAACWFRHRKPYSSVHLAITLALLALAMPARAATTVSTNEQGQIIVTSTLTNMDALMAAIKAELTANAPASVGNFGTTVLGYFSSFNPELTNVFSANKGYAFAGVDSIQGGKVSLANSLCIDYKVFGGLALDALTRNGGVSGTIISQSAGVAFNVPIKDVNVALFAHAGYDFQAEAGAQKYYGEVGARAMKALGKQTFAGVSISAAYPSKQQAFGAFCGFCF